MLGLRLGFSMGSQQPQSTGTIDLPGTGGTILLAESSDDLQLEESTDRIIKEIT